MNLAPLRRVHSSENLLAAVRRGSWKGADHRRAPSVTGIEVHFIERPAGDHRSPVERPNAHPEARPRGVNLEHVGGHIPAIAPHAQLGIIVQSSR